MKLMEIRKMMVNKKVGVYKGIKEYKVELDKKWVKRSKKMKKDRMVMRNKRMKRGGLRNIMMGK
jgi:hypothetical protein